MTDLEPRAAVIRLRPEQAERLQALLAAPGLHVERVLDVGRAPNGDLLVVVPEPGARAADLVLVPGWPAPGEAVTVLAPLAGALAALHAAGVAHGGVGVQAVRFDGDGAPYWAGPGSPVVARTAGEAAFAAAVAADVAAFGDLCRALLGRAAPAGSDLVALADALFGVASPEPVRLHPAPAIPPPAQGPPSRLLPAADPVLGRAGASRAARTVAAALRTVRLRVWIAAGAVAVLLAVVPALLPADRSEPAATSAARPSSRAVPTVAATTGPLAAVRALVVERARCLTAGDARCLAGVDAAGSPVLHADRAAVAAGAEPVRVDPARLALRSAGGGLALADAAGTTVLAVREPDGWRLRDVVPKPGNDEGRAP